MIPPGAWATASAALAPALILRNSGVGVRSADKPSRLDPQPGGGHGLGFFLLGHGIRGGLLLRQLARMDDDQAQCLQGDAAIAVLDLDVAAQALPMPEARGLIPPPPGLLHQQGQGRLPAPPRLAFLPDGTRARDSCYEPDLAL